MTDAHKQLQIADLQLSPKPGRPKSGNALSRAEIQKAYRERTKQKGKKSVLLDSFEIGLLTSFVTGMLRKVEADTVLAGYYSDLLNKFKAAENLDAPKAIRRAQNVDDAGEISAPVPGKARRSSKTKPNGSSS